MVNRSLSYHQILWSAYVVYFKEIYKFKKQNDSTVLDIYRMAHKEFFENTRLAVLPCITFKFYHSFIYKHWHKHMLYNICNIINTES